jgi:hypothetical protein
MTFEDELLRLAHIWKPYGGPPKEEVFEKFGISLSEFDGRIHANARNQSDRAREVTTLAHSHFRTS